MTTLPTQPPVQTPTSAREALADRFLARVAALSPREWGELDAIGDRFLASDPIALWRRARHFAALAARVPGIEDLVTVVGFVGLGVAEVLWAVGGGRRGRWLAPKRLPPNAPAEARQLVGRMETLWDVASLQPGGPGPAAECLTVALLALWTRHLVPEEAFARVYSLVEPVIPARSLS
jgi:hypothetical protein